MVTASIVVHIRAEIHLFNRFSFFHFYRARTRQGQLIQNVMTATSTIYTYSEYSLYDERFMVESTFYTAVFYCTNTIET